MANPPQIMAKLILVLHVFVSSFRLVFETAYP